VVNVMLSGGIVLLVALLGTPLFIRVLVRYRYGQIIRDDLVHHQMKRGKPTMGGVVIIGAAVLGYFGSYAVLLLINSAGRLQAGPGPAPGGLLVLFLLLGLGLIGFLDDYVKVRKARSLRLTSRQKLLGQALVTVVFALAGVLVSGASNGVNITDGLDGLAAGASVMVFGAYSMIAMWQNSPSGALAPSASYEVANALDLAVVSSAMAGACAGFLWWNASPAKIIMGDTGSLSLGAAMAGLAILTHTQLLLVVLGGLFVIVTGSVIIQVISFKTTGKRVFLISPLHHHFELLGWPEVRIVTRFWIVAGICVGIGLAIFYGERLVDF